jgi:hypothetical protein
MRVGMALGFCLCLALGDVCVSWAVFEMILIEKEIDDDNVVIRRPSGERLRLNKWSMRFSPLVFEGKTFPADVTSLWVTIYVEGRDPIKWSVEESLGGAAKRLLPSTPSTVPPQPSVATREVISRVQAALIILKHDPGGITGELTPQTRDAIEAFQRREQLTADGSVTRNLLLRLAASLLRDQQTNRYALEVAETLYQAAIGSARVTEGPDIVETNIRGEFTGWTGETIFILDNGQIWQQASYAYTYYYAYSPKIVIYKTSDGHRLMVEGVNDSIAVRRLK